MFTVNKIWAALAQKWSNVRVKVVRRRQGARRAAATAATGKTQAEGGWRRRGLWACCVDLNFNLEKSDGGKAHAASLRLQRPVRRRRRARVLRWGVWARCVARPRRTPRSSGCRDRQGAGGSKDGARDAARVKAKAGAR